MDFIESVAASGVGDEFIVDGDGNFLVDVPD